MSNIRDVSKAAGVSVATVSRALRNPEKVAEDTRARVLEAVRAVDYRPNMMARNFRSRQAFAVVVLAPDIANPFFARVVRGIEQVAQKGGYAVLLGDTQGRPDREAEYLNLVRSSQADGVIQLSARIDPQALARLWREGETPAIVNACECADTDFCSRVRIDNIAAARAMSDHLISLGHRRIGVVTGPPASPLTRDRLVGYRQALEAAGIVHDPALTVEGDFSLQSGQDAVPRFLKAADRPSAIFCFNDEMAIGAIRGLKTAGLSTPTDMSVAGFDDIDFARFADPPLTTVAQPMEELGRVAMSALLEILGGAAPAVRTHILPTVLVARESTAPPRG
jgi:LacI family repressor for deo operon, udp, cdd, tsx, nupC, and nupG